jgi:beta-glucanase (GH16 family)
MVGPCEPIPIGPSSLPHDRLIWRDEFDGPALDRTRWNVRDDDTYGDGNGEEQRYFARNVGIVNQQLTIAAKAEPTAGKAYTSGFVTTRNLAGQPDRFSFTQGYIEVCASLPHGGGFWPAFWLVGAQGAPAWPAYGEFDVFEGYGHDYIESTVHWQSTAGRHVQYGGQELDVANVSGKHLYGLLWTMAGLSVYVDGVQRWTWLAGADVSALAALALPHTINLNLAVGGDGPRKYHGWDGTWQPGELPGVMMVDYVRVWQ